MANLSDIITPSNILTASNTATVTNKTISGANNTLSNIDLASQITGTLPVANGGTGTTSTTFANLTTNVTGTLPIANGGTGATSLTANNVLLGNGTSAPQTVAPGTSGNVLTSNGTTWQSTAPAAGGAWTLLSTVTASAAATADVETTFDSTYDSYVIIGSGIFASSSGGLSIRLKIGGSYLTSGYDAGHIRQSLNSGSYNYGNIVDGDRINNASGADLKTSASTPARIVIELSNPSVSKTQAISYISNTVLTTSTNDRAYGQGQNRTAGVLTGVQFYGDAGNITGDFRLYGITNS